MQNDNQYIAASVRFKSHIDHEIFSKKRVLKDQHYRWLSEFGQ